MLSILTALSILLKDKRGFGLARTIRLSHHGILRSTGIIQFKVQKKAILTPFFWRCSLLERQTKWFTPVNWSTSHEMQQETTSTSAQVLGVFFKRRMSSCQASAQLSLPQLAWPLQPSRRIRTSMDHLHLKNPTTWRTSPQQTLTFLVPTVTLLATVVLHLRTILDLGPTICRKVACRPLPIA